MGEPYTLEKLALHYEWLAEEEGAIADSFHLAAAAAIRECDRHRGIGGSFRIIDVAATLRAEDITNQYLKQITEKQ